MSSPSGKEAEICALAGRIAQLPMGSQKAVLGLLLRRAPVEVLGGVALYLDLRAVEK
jgi:hypothetical protein